jgi:predicted Rossmann-fold nucleotide-binding protein
MATDTPLTPKAERRAIERIIRFSRLPYNPFRKSLYSVKELMSGYDPNNPGKSLDERIAQHVNGSGKKMPSVHEALAQRIHDHAIDSALYRFAQPTGKPRRRIIGVMGSHGTARTDVTYKLVAQLAWQLRQEGFSIVSGGGPGIMEAANLGAYFSNYLTSDLDAALALLAKAPDYTSDPTGYVAAAKEVRTRYPNDSGESLAIPTWAYSTEPTGQFSSKIGKYFANSIREDGLLAIAADGVVFARGSEGTLQEVFQNAAHNAYWSFHSRAAMVFLNNQGFFTQPPSIVDVVAAQAKRAHPPYDGFIGLCATAKEVVDFIKAHPMQPEPVPGATRTYGISNLSVV